MNKGEEEGATVFKVLILTWDCHHLNIYYYKKFICYIVNLPNLHFRNLEIGLQLLSTNLLINIKKCL